MKRILSFLLFFVLLYFASTDLVWAKEVSIGIQPTVLRIKSKLPASVQAQIMLSNPSDEEVNLVPSYKAFKASSDDKGSPTYIDSDSLPFYDTLISRISILDSGSKVESVNLLPHRAKRLTIFIPIQPDTKLQDYYFSVIFTNEGSLGSNTSTKINTAVGTHILLSVGETEPQKVQIEKFESASFLTSGPVYFNILIDNKGNQNVSVNGLLKISDMFERSSSISILPQNILSRSKRLIVGTSSQSKYNEGIKSGIVIWNEPFLFGVYTAELSLTSDNIPLPPRKISFFAVPASIILTLTIILAFIIIFYLRVRNKLNFKNS